MMSSLCFLNLSLKLAKDNQSAELKLTKLIVQSKSHKICKLYTIWSERYTLAPFLSSGSLRLYSIPSQFVLMSANNVDGYCLKIYFCELVIGYVDINLSTILAQKQLLQSGVKARFPISDVKLIQFSSFIYFHITKIQCYISL